MKFLAATALTALLSFAIGLFTVLPWFSFVFCALIVAVAVHQKPFKAFAAGFVAVFILWVVLVAMIDAANEHLLSKKSGQRGKLINSTLACPGVLSTRRIYRGLLRSYPGTNE